MAAVTPTITCNESPIPATYQVLSIDIRREVNRIPFAEIRLIDGNAATKTFPASESTLFTPGSTIKIQVRRGSDPDQLLFSGIVVRHGIAASTQGSALIVGCKDAAVGLTGVRMSAVYADLDDGKIIEQLLSSAGVSKGTFATTSLSHPDMVQYNCTPWDFILSRADALGLMVVVQDGVLSLVQMAAPSGTAVKLAYGMDQIYDLELEADAEHQYSAVQSLSWDPKAQAMTSPVSATAISASPGNFTADTLATAVNNKTRTLTHPVPVIANEMQALADARMARSRMALVRGRVSILGATTIKLMGRVTLDGLGKRFNGDATVTGIRHSIDRSGWKTDLQFGLSPEEFSKKPQITDSRAAGLLPPVSGLQIGVVAAGVDPADELRVKVILPGISSDAAQAVWARLASPDAGAARGYYFRPEPKDEVVVGFLNDDPRCPVILGGLYSSGIAAPSIMGAPDDNNLKRGIVTKSGTIIGFDDTDKKSQIFISTTGGTELRFNDDKEQVTLKDKFGNQIQLDKNGITLTSAKKFTVNASDAIAIKGSKVDVQ